MAIAKINFISKCLKRTVDVDIILPIDNLSFDDNMKVNHVGPFPTLYLLHGIFGDHQDWISGTRIQRWAQEYNLAVVMPSGENKFYVDNEDNGEYYGRFIGEELVEMTRAMFPLSSKKEDTYIGGLSMGGYGAIINGLKYYQTFGAICGLSSALMLDDWIQLNPPIIPFVDAKKYYTSLFGDPTLLKGSDKDYYALINNIPKESFPRIYLCCGKQDALLSKNIDYYHYLKNKNIDVTFYSEDGGHEWDFWDRNILKILEWLPIKKSTMGINSGHITEEDYE